MLVAFLFELLYVSSSYSIFLPLLLCFIFFKRLDGSFKSLTFLLFITIAFETTANFVKYYYATVPGKYNLFLYHLLILIEFSLLAWIYKTEFRNFVPAKLFSTLIVFFLIFSVTNTILVMEPSHSVMEFFRNFRYIAKFNNYAQLLEDFLLMSFAFFYFYKLMKELKVESLEKEAFFLFNIGILIYYSSKFTLDIFNNFIIEYFINLSGITWGVHSIANILLHIFYSLAIWQNSRK